MKKLDEAIAKLKEISRDPRVWKDCRTDGYVASAIVLITQAQTEVAVYEAEIEALNKKIRTLEAPH
jgi:hypothetical protein